ncbi:MAG TPA: SAM-dependent methyltransferase [Bacteroidales bacterium]|nr:SAM-dependent methyltransferase [Bacteroidales bacterium]
MSSKTGRLFLIPASLGSENIQAILPAHNSEVVNGLDMFIVENLRTARRFLRAAGYLRSFDEVQFFLLNKHSSEGDLPEFVQMMLNGKNIGLISEAGCPCIADPGHEVVLLAHQNGIPVVPLVGPSSILLALMASGFNGQQFAFHGYLPIDKTERARKLKQLELAAWKDSQTQIFMETPFRNNQLMTAMVEILRPDTLLCVACDLTLTSEFIKSQPVVNWKKNMPDLHKRTSIFLLYRQ